MTFAKYEGFRLFGQGWNNGRRLAGLDESTLAGPVADKHATLSQFRFSLCFENTRFPGYVTEKIFDCFFAGAIPIYLGAPDIAELVPRAAFIDVDEFSTFDELHEFLWHMDAHTGNAYRDAAREFLASPAFGRFTATSFVETALAALKA